MPLSDWRMVSGRTPARVCCVSLLRMPAQLPAPLAHDSIALPPALPPASHSSSTHPLTPGLQRPEELQYLKRPDGSPWQLGSGGFGVVLKAKRGGVQPVAVKVLRSSGEAATLLGEAGFQREISILRACRDANILQFVVRAGRPYVSIDGWAVVGARGGVWARPGKCLCPLLC